jgi:hypothetical protein
MKNNLINIKLQKKDIKKNFYVIKKSKVILKKKTKN